MQAILIINFVYLFHLFGERHFVSRNEMLIERFNETANMFLTVLLFSTTAIEKEEQRFLAGLTLNYLVIGLFVLNSIYVGVLIVLDVCHNC